MQRKTDAKILQYVKGVCNKVLDDFLKVLKRLKMLFLKCSLYPNVNSTFQRVRNDYIFKSHGGNLFLPYAAPFQK